MNCEFKAKYVVIWVDGLIRGFSQYVQLSSYLKACKEDIMCQHMEYRVFKIENYKIEELDL